MLSRIRRALADKEGGYTLVEVLVVIGLLGVISTLMTTALVNTSQSAGKVGNKNQQSNQERLAIDAMSRTIRSAVRYNTATSIWLKNGALVGGKTVVNNGTETWFYSNLDNDSATACGPEVVHYYVNAQSQLWEERTYPDASSVAGAWTFTGQPKYKRKLVDLVQSPGGSVPLIFTYLTDSASTAINTIASPALTDTASTTVGSVLATLVTKSLGVRGTSSTQLQTIRIVNADAPAGSGGAGC